MHIPGTPHKEYIYIDKDPDYSKCPNCKKNADEYEKWYSESYRNNPDPAMYTILDHKQVGSHLVLKVVYDNIKIDKYERTKIMVLKATPIDLLKRKTLDPHFEKEGIVIARFSPTAQGWADAIHFAYYREDKCKSNSL